jgi:hypothetical protein
LPDLRVGSIHRLIILRADVNRKKRQHKREDGYETRVRHDD